MRVCLTVAYDGTNYHGWQFQPNGITIESVLNQALSDLLGEEITVIGASRTDSGVHSLGNVAVFDTNSKIPEISRSNKKKKHLFLSSCARCPKYAESGKIFYGRA